ncbi:U32 family peptidase [Nocardia sp. XZ_19_369]|uniref:U32 family peptidase n=1 Tax=Nocardia sp. XZ_19_369 TaxID=2769487 RepID=UPI001E2DCF0E|nr:U32 family peptidase [Nocardia sp. XZ_19_369]
MRFFGEARELLTAVGLPDGDSDAGLDESALRFPDGGRWRIEVPTVNCADAAEMLLIGAALRGVRIDRITETKGMCRHTDAEIRRYVALGRDHGVEILMSVGPRATTDISATARTPEGSRIGYRLRGGEKLVQAIADILRGIELGVRGLVVYDEGLLATLNALRRQGKLPAELHLKVSAHCGHGNPASVRLMEQHGANSINPVRDLTVPMLAGLRQAVTVPLDIHVDNPATSGNFIRTLDAPDFARVASPVYLKTGNSALPGHGVNPTPAQVEDMLDQIKIVAETMARHYPSAPQAAPAAAMAKVI